MKLTYTARNGRIAIEAEVASEKGAFEALATFQEILEEPACGCCGSDAIRHDVRVVDDHKFYHLCCRACGARLDFGQTKKGEHLFAKRRGEDKQRLPNAGWYRYQPEQAQADPLIAAISQAGDRRALELVGKQIKEEVAAGRIDPTRAATYRGVYDARLRELGGGKGRVA